MKISWLGRINRNQFIALLRVYLSLAFRPRSRSTGKKQLVPRTFLPFIIYGWFGFFMTLMLLKKGVSPEVYGFSSIAYTMVMVFFAVLHEFDIILITSEDADIVGHRPVNEATYSAAKLITFTLYVLFLCASLALIPSVGSLFVAETGWLFPAALFISAAAASLAAGYLVVIVYTELLARISGKTLKDVLTYLQVIFTMGLFVGFQLMSTTDMAALPSMPYFSGTWAMALPPAWYASLARLLGGTVSPGVIAGSITAVLVTALFVAAGASRFSMRGAMKMARLLQESEKADVTENQGESTVPWLARIFAAGTEAQAGYLLTAKMLRRDRSIRTGVISMGAILLATCVLEFVKGDVINPFVQHAGPDESFSYFTFFSIFITLSLVNLVQYSIDWKGGWIFNIVPFEHPGRIYRGVIFVLATRVLLPLYGLVLILYSLHMSIVHAFFNMLITVMISLLSAAAGLIIVKDFPFSMQRVPGQRSRSFFVLLLVIPLAVISAAARPLMFKTIPHSIGAAACLAICACLVLRRAEKMLDTRLLKRP